MCLCGFILLLTCMCTCVLFDVRMHVCMFDVCMHVCMFDVCMFDVCMYVCAV